MFASWGSLMSRYRWAVLGGVLIAVLACGTWGIGVFGQLTEGGYGDRGSESARAARAIERGLGPRGGDVGLVYGVGTGTVDDPGVGAWPHCRPTPSCPQARTGSRGPRS